jgi:hypothetical protein
LFDFAGGVFRFTSLVWSPLGLSKTLHKVAALMAVRNSRSCLPHLRWHGWIAWLRHDPELVRLFWEHAAQDRGAAITSRIDEPSTEADFGANRDWERESV